MNIDNANLRRMKCIVFLCILSIYKINIRVHEISMMERYDSRCNFGSEKFTFSYEYYHVATC
jgi:hypothetical protein